MNQSTTNQSIPEIAPPPAGLLAGHRKLYVAMLMLALALGYFGYTAFQSATVFYLTVDELLNGGAQTGETVRVSGKLVPDSFQREPEGTVAYFNLTSGGQPLPAMYDGILPELFFNEHSEIVLEGHYQASDSGGGPETSPPSPSSGGGKAAGVFVASSVIVKCPSKYQALESESTA